MHRKKYNVAILGATGAVGSELMSLLIERDFPVADLKLLASPKSTGKTLSFNGQDLVIAPVTPESFNGIDIVLASAGASVSKEWAAIAVSKGAVVIDNSSAFRQDPKVPLVVPEVNPQALDHHQGIIANPNCTTILMNLAVYPLHKMKPVKRIVAATYQSVSGAGARAMDELIEQSQAILNNQEPKAEILPYPIGFNLFLHNSPMDDQGYCAEEMKMVNETRKIFDYPDIQITATCVRVPVLRAHSEAINIEFSEPFSIVTAKELLSKAPGVELIEDWSRQYFPMPIAASGKDNVLVGRIRQDISHPNCIELWLCGDQIRKGAALNAVQIAEVLIDRNLI
ncbi:aspartate-semialdehyde dehydrogenase [Synechococcus sp. PCC 7502]|uniref:aspartate-semialdehyde dehydrogenase n=1 Tax=Synechococcus sp. PCC 7502 TaxID=1173263 RepID=UPI00029F9D2B|nr:aspartate-semialdehyde dehydrogenase [Synechococcus sp. PCC 7502]AFY73758.1 aspartate-semialdehyde dehydrogenase [Synechococcus sp. PCC 7502]